MKAFTEITQNSALGVIKGLYFWIKSNNLFNNSQTNKKTQHTYCKVLCFNCKIPLFLRSKTTAIFSSNMILTHATMPLSLISPNKSFEYCLYKADLSLYTICCFLQLFSLIICIKIEAGVKMRGEFWIFNRTCKRALKMLKKSIQTYFLEERNEKAP